MKRIRKYKEKLKKVDKNTKKSTLIVYAVLRILVIICMIF